MKPNNSLIKEESKTFNTSISDSSNINSDNEKSKKEKIDKTEYKEIITQLENYCIQNTKDEVKPDYVNKLISSLIDNNIPNLRDKIEKAVIESNSVNHNNQINNNKSLFNNTLRSNCKKNNTNNNKSNKQSTSKAQINKAINIVAEQSEIHYFNKNIDLHHLDKLIENSQAKYNILISGSIDIYYAKLEPFYLTDLEYIEYILRLRANDEFYLLSKIIAKNENFDFKKLINQHENKTIKFDEVISNIIERIKRNMLFSQSEVNEEYIRIIKNIEKDINYKYVFNGTKIPDFSAVLYQNSQRSKRKSKLEFEYNINMDNKENDVNTESSYNCSSKNNRFYDNNLKRLLKEEELNNSKDSIDDYNIAQIDQNNNTRNSHINRNHDNNNFTNKDKLLKINLNNLDTKSSISKASIRSNNTKSSARYNKLMNMPNKNTQKTNLTNNTNNESSNKNRSLITRIDKSSFIRTSLINNKKMNDDINKEIIIKQEKLSENYYRDSNRLINFNPLRKRDSNFIINNKNINNINDSNDVKKSAFGVKFKLNHNKILDYTNNYNNNSNSNSNSKIIDYSEDSKSFDSVSIDDKSNLDINKKYSGTIFKKFIENEEKDSNISIIKRKGKEKDNKEEVFSKRRPNNTVSLSGINQINKNVFKSESKSKIFNLKYPINLSRSISNIRERNVDSNKSIMHIYNNKDTKDINNFYTHDKNESVNEVNIIRKRNALSRSTKIKKLDNINAIDDTIVNSNKQYNNSNLLLQIPSSSSISSNLKLRGISNANVNVKNNLEHNIKSNISNNSNSNNTSLVSTNKTNSINNINTIIHKMPKPSRDNKPSFRNLNKQSLFNSSTNNNINNTQIKKSSSILNSHLKLLKKIELEKHTSTLKAPQRKRRMALETSNYENYLNKIQFKQRVEPNNRTIIDFKDTYPEKKKLYLIKFVYLKTLTSNSFFHETDLLDSLNRVHLLPYTTENILLLKLSKSTYEKYLKTIIDKEKYNLANFILNGYLFNSFIKFTFLSSVFPIATKKTIHNNLDFNNTIKKLSSENIMIITKGEIRLKFIQPIYDFIHKHSTYFNFKFPFEIKSYLSETPNFRKYLKNIENSKLMDIKTASSNDILGLEDVFKLKLDFSELFFSSRYSNSDYVEFSESLFNYELHSSTVDVLLIPKSYISELTKLDFDFISKMNNYVIQKKSIISERIKQILICMYEYYIQFLSKIPNRGVLIIEMDKNLNQNMNRYSNTCRSSKLRLLYPDKKVFSKEFIYKDYLETKNKENSREKEYKKQIKMIAEKAMKNNNSNSVKKIASNRRRTYSAFSEKIIISVNSTTGRKKGENNYRSINKTKHSGNVIDKYRENIAYSTHNKNIANTLAGSSRFHKLKNEIDWSKNTYCEGLNSISRSSSNTNLSQINNSNFDRSEKNTLLSRNKERKNNRYIITKNNKQNSENKIEIINNISSSNISSSSYKDHYLSSNANIKSPNTVNNYTNRNTLIHYNNNKSNQVSKRSVKINLPEEKEIESKKSVCISEQEVIRIEKRGGLNESGFNPVSTNSVFKIKKSDNSNLFKEKTVSMSSINKVDSNISIIRKPKHEELENTSNLTKLHLENTQNKYINDNIRDNDHNSIAKSVVNNSHDGDIKNNEETKYINVINLSKSSYSKQRAESTKENKKFYSFIEDNKAINKPVLFSLDNKLEYSASLKGVKNIKLRDEKLGNLINMIQENNTNTFIKIKNNKTNYKKNLIRPHSTTLKALNKNKMISVNTLDSTRCVINKENKKDEELRKTHCFNNNNPHKKIPLIKNSFRKSKINNAKTDKYNSIISTNKFDFQTINNPTIHIPVININKIVNANNNNINNNAVLKRDNTAFLRNEFTKIFDNYKERELTFTGLKIISHLNEKRNKSFINETTREQIKEEEQNVIINKIKKELEDSKPKKKKFKQDLTIAVYGRPQEIILKSIYNK